MLEVRHEPTAPTRTLRLASGDKIDAHRHDDHQIVYAGRGVLAVTNKFRFVASKRPLDRSIPKISHRYVGHYDDPRRWMFSAWMKLTDKGQELALSLEERAIDSYREHEVTQDFSTHKMAEPTQLGAQITEWEPEGNLLHRDVA
jgi:hypothetical protein